MPLYDWSFYFEITIIIINKKQLQLFIFFLL